jgi:hypothetical protein
MLSSLNKVDIKIKRLFFPHGKCAFKLKTDLRVSRVTPTVLKCMKSP